MILTFSAAVGGWQALVHRWQLVSNDVCSEGAIIVLRRSLNLKLTGTFGPIASFLSICALVQSWRAHIESNDADQQTSSIPDPAW
jgi:hypothetical protein